jgi:hypothetical protein
VPPPLLGWAQVAQTARLSDQTAEAAGSYLRRYYELTEAARADLGQRLASAVLAQVSPPPPPGTPPAAFLAAVLAIRRDHEHARLAGQQRLVQEASRPDGETAGPGTAGTAWPPGGPAPGASTWAPPTAPAPQPGRAGTPPGGQWSGPGAVAPPAPPPAQPEPVPPAADQPGYGFAPPA